MEILCRDLVKRAEVLLRDHVIEILYRQSPLKDAGMRAKGIIWQIILSIVRIPGVLSTWHSALRALPGHPDEHTAFLRFLFPKHCDRTEGVLTVSVKASVHSRWYPRHPAFSLQISAQNGSCDMSMCISTAQPRTKRAWQSWGAAFPHLLKFQHKKALVACPCAFRL